jgi:hypothetical protein
VSPSRAWPAALQLALDKALNPDAAARYDTATEFARDIASGISADTSAAAATRRMTPLVTRKIGVQPSRAATSENTRTASSGGRSRWLLAALVLIAVGGVVATRVVNWHPAALRDSSQSAASVSAVPRRDSAVNEISSTPDTSVAVRDSAAHGTARVAAVDTTTVAATLPARPNAAPPRVGAASTALITPDTNPITTVKQQAAPGTATAGRHRWLRASGDSAAPLPAEPSPLAGEAREVLGHLNRARLFFASREPARAVPELRTANEEYTIFVTDHADTPESRMMTNQFRIALSQVITACHTASDSAVAAGRRALLCENMERAGRGAVRGDAGSPAGRGARRAQRPGVSP